MPQGPRQLNQPSTEDPPPKRFQFRPWDDRFGCGYVVIFLASFGAAVAAFVAAVRSTTEAALARSVAAFVAAVGGGFAIAIVYQVVRGIGLRAWSSVGSEQTLTVLERGRHRFRYWGFVLGGLLAAGTMLALAAWMWFNVDRVAEWMGGHPPRGGYG
jgi:hypothetical protein